MATTSVLKKQVKNFVDKASEKELRMIYSLFEIGGGGLVGANK